jgi:hypothetical protein
VPAKTVSLNLADKLVICRLADRLSVSRIPEEVALAWTNTTTKSGISRTPFRVPVEIPRQRPTRGRLALCLAAAFHGDWNSRQIVEWLEMQRLLGVELVVVYNRSMSAEAGKVFSEYNKQGKLDNGDRFVELRQSHGWLDGVDSTFGHQTSTINDCMYRYMGSFRYLAVIDFDEVIVPRKNFTTIPQLIDNLAVNRTVGSFLFRNAQYFVGPLKDDNYDDVYRLIPASQRNSSLSIYLTRRRRAAVSPPHFVVKSILDADACIGMWVHYCLTYTSQFQEKGGANVVSRLDVDVELAQKHHYRTECNFDHYPTIYAPGSCTRAMQTAVVDNVLEKYSSRLVMRLLEQYEKTFKQFLGLRVELVDMDLFCSINCASLAFFSLIVT